MTNNSNRNTTHAKPNHSPSPLRVFMRYRHDGAPRWTHRTSPCTLSGAPIAVRISDMNWMQVERFLEHDDRGVLPLGSTEQHSHLRLTVDCILPERVAAEAAE
ncbi:MAG: creatininase family protein, partial [Gemmatimonadaceae bacterium]